METTAQRLTASEKRFVQEMRIIMHMSLSDLLRLEKIRVPIGI